MSRQCFNKLVACGAMILFLVAPFPVRSEAAVSPSVSRVLSQIQRVYEQTEDISADFVQVSRLKSLAVGGPGGGLKEQRAEGKLYIKKPGMIRWDYLKPHPLQLISNGKILWRYSPAEKAAYRDNLASAGNTPLSFLTGSGKIREDFKAALASGERKSEAGFVAVELVPREPLPTVQKLVLQVNGTNDEIQQITFWDHFGNRTTITFSNVRFNVGLSSSLFHFTPPEGVRVESLPGISMWR